MWVVELENSLVKKLCDKTKVNPLPDHESECQLPNEFGNCFKDNICQIQRDIGASEPPHIPQREVPQLESFRFTEDDVWSRLIK